jgi:hypothetical protein
VKSTQKPIELTPGSLQVSHGFRVRRAILGNELIYERALDAFEVHVACLARWDCPLKRLYLNENQVGDAGALALANAVAANSSSFAFRSALAAKSGAGAGAANSTAGESAGADAGAVQQIF